MFRWVFGAVAALTASSALAVAPLVGTLELIWGDAAPEAADRAPRFEAAVVDDLGVRHPLDAASARIAAGNLFALAGHRVAVSLDGGLSETGALPASAIVDMDVPDKSGVMPNLVSGSQPWVSILCKFSDSTSEPKPLTYFSTMFANTSGHLDDFWREVSYDKVNIAGSTASGWYTLPHPRAYYVPAGGSANLALLFTDCTNAANAAINFAPFVGINLMFNGDLDGFAWGGGHFATLDGVSKNWRTTWEPPWGFQNEAPLAHEMGHGFGLPHANNSDGDSNPYDNPWDDMSDTWSNAVHDATYGSLPKHISVYHRDQLGWIDAPRKLTIAADGVSSGLVLDRASMRGSTHLQMIVVALSAVPGTHYYTIETRKRIGAYEAALAGDAVIIHEVDTTRSEPAWSVDATAPPADTANDPGSMFVVGETYSAPGGAFTVHVDSATADGFVVSVNRTVDRIFADGYDGP